MHVLRVLGLVFNVVVVGYLIFVMVEAFRQPERTSKKWTILIGGTVLLLAPVGLFLRFFAPVLQYYLIYPLAIGLFLYLTKKL